MDWLTFSSRIVGSIAWPGVALLAVVLLRPALLALLPVLQNVKGFGIEASFGRVLEQARAVVDDTTALAAPPATSSEFASEDRDFLIELAGLSPRSVVLESWREVELAIFSAVNQTTNDQGRHNQFVVGAARRLLDAGDLDDPTFQILTMLRNLRNRAAHETNFDIRSDDAVEYAILARHVVDQIAHNVGREPEEP